MTINELNLEDLNNYLLRVISIYDSKTDGRHFDVPMEDQIIDVPITLRQLRLIQSSIEYRMEAIQLSHMPVGIV